MPTLLALDLELGPELENALRECVDRHTAFCVLDQRLSPRRREAELAALGATALRDERGVHPLNTGQSVDDQVGLVMLTSGSSGTPKAVELTWSALEASARLTNNALREGTPSAWYPCLPANHIGGLAVLLRAIYTDARLIWGPRDDIARAPTLGATHVSLVRRQLAHHDVSGYSRVLLGGAKPPEELPPNVITTWGMTETGSGVVYNARPLDGVDVAIVANELVVKSPTLFRSYRGAPRPSVSGPDGRDDWFPTGDGARIDDGVVQVFGRLGFLINTGAEKLWPEELEAVLSRVSGVRDAAVYGAPDPEWGQKVIALVVSDGATYDEQIRAAASEQMGPWAKPKEIRYVAAIPRTSNGKISRRNLEHLA